MVVDLRNTDGARSVVPTTIGFHAEVALLRAVIRAAGVCWSVLFVTVGIGYELQLYGDGAIFSYAVAVEDSWAFHWHNIASRLFVHLFTHLPAETYVTITRDARGAIVIYGLLFFAAPLLGLGGTFVADRSRGRVIFTFACLSTAGLCPLVFGFPTEMWIAHSLFWPALAVSHFARSNEFGSAAILTLLLALVFTHDGALILAAGILATALLRGPRDFVFLRVSAALFIVLCLWVAVKLALPPDQYFSSIILTAALNFIDVTVLAGKPILLIVTALGFYVVVLVALRQVAPANACAFSTLIVAVGLAVYWLWFDRLLHAEDRYAFRTALAVATPALGVLAGVAALHADARLSVGRASLSRLLPLLRRCALAGPATGAIFLIMLAHAVETAKFISSWAHYKAAVRALATGNTADPSLGDPQFVSADRISAGLNRLSWPSTTPYLSVLVAPGFQPKRLVVEPDPGYYWLSCQVATANHEARRSIPQESRLLVRVLACLRRPY